MELGARIAEALLARAEGAEVLNGAGNHVVPQLEVDAAGLLYREEVSASSSSSLFLGKEGQLTLDLALLDDLAIVVNLDLWALPGHVEVCLDGHVGSGWCEESFIERCSRGGVAGGAERSEQRRSLEVGHGGVSFVGCQWL
jgi:hypothetical protein